MDSMRSLNSSLPSSRPSRSAPPEELLQAFRTAALSVTNLYKSAATSQTNASRAGYQDALEDLLNFLDNENLGLQDGEGWRVRQWATARYDGTSSTGDAGVDDREQDDAELGTRDVSSDRDNTTVATVQSEDTAHASRHESEEDSDSAEKAPIFRFTANASSDNSMQTDATCSSQTIDEPSSSASTAPIRVEVLNRGNRQTSRSHHARHNTHTNSKDFTFTTGTKRKIQLSDFFDISNISDKRDGPGGGSGPKRGRFV